MHEILQSDNKSVKFSYAIGNQIERNFTVRYCIEPMIKKRRDIMKNFNNLFSGLWSNVVVKNGCSVHKYSQSTPL